MGYKFSKIIVLAGHYGCGKTNLAATAESLSSYTQNASVSDSSAAEILSFAAMHAAVISSGSKFLSENALDKIHQLGDTKEDSKK